MVDAVTTTTTPPVAGSTPTTPVVAAVVEPTITAVPVGEPKPSIAGEPAKDDKKSEAVVPAPFDPKAYKAPDGMTVDEKMLGDYAAIINDNKLSASERGTKMLDLYNSAMKQVGESHTKAWSDTNEKWVNEVKADPEIGGTKFEPTKQMISRAIDTLGPEMSKTFRQSLDITGVGNNPAFIRGMAKLASALTEGGHVAGNPPGGKDKALRDVFFPNSPDMKD